MSPSNESVEVSLFERNLTRTELPPRGAIVRAICCLFLPLDEGPLPVWRDD
jgi:hypothetical protein